MSTSTPNRDASYPQDAAPGGSPTGPTDSPTASEGSRHRGHGRGHTWLMLLMCLPMVVLVGALVATGAVGGGAILYAMGCMLMMGVMMLFMSGDHRH